MSAPEPILVRMFVDDVSGIGLWLSGGPRPSFREESLPIPAELRERIQAWVDEYTEWILGPRDRYGEQWPLEHSWRGHDLSEDLQAALGDGYQVDYHPHVRVGRDGRPLRAVSLARLSDGELDELPDVPAQLRDRLLEWMGQRSRFEGVDEPYSDRYAWEDEGMAVLHELQRVLGPAYHVKPG
jgi:hypothetical protein